MKKLLLVMKENGKVTGAVILRIAEASISKKRGPAEYVEATYFVPSLTQKEIDNLHDICEKINCYPVIHNVEAEDIKKVGLTKSITVPLAASRETKNFEHMSQINKALKFKDYESELPDYLK